MNGHSSLSLAQVIRPLIRFSPPLLCTLILFFLFPLPSAQITTFNTHNSHHILFNQIGHLASEMSYIHLAIPVNLSTIEHSINTFNNYLQTFSNLKTDHSNKLHFARLISELATFASSELTKLSGKLHFMDHLLPEDTSASTSRHKRFVDFILFEDCKNQDHLVRVRYQNCREHFYFTKNQLTLCQAQLSHFKESDIPDYSYLSLKTPRQGKFFWIGKYERCKSDKNYNNHLLATCDGHTQLLNNTLLDCLSQLKAHPSLSQGIFKNFNPDRLPFSNASRTTTTTPPPPTTYAFYPFAPTRAPYHGTTAPPLTPPPLHRVSRQVLAAVALVSGVLGTFLGLFDHKEINDIQNNLLQLSDQHKILTSVVRKHEHEIQTLHDQLTQLTNTVEALIMYNPTLVYAILNQNLNLVKDKMSSLINTLQQLQHQRLAVDLLDEHQLQTVFEAALNSAKNSNVQLLPTRAQDLFQLDASYIRKEAEVLIILHIPCVKSAESLTLYEYIPFPYPLKFDPAHPTPSPGQLFTLQDLANSPYGHISSALYFHSEFSMIAIGRNSNINTASYKLISHSELSSCIQKNHIYLCENLQTLRNDLEGSCLGALYLQHETGVIENCQINRKPLKEVTYRISQTDHIVFSPQSFTTQILCENGTHFPQKLSGTTYLHIPPFCKIQLRNHSLSSNGNIRVAPNPLIFQWDLKPNLLPIHLLSATAHLDLLINELHSNLSAFRSQPKDKFTDEQFAQLLQTHILTPSSSSAIVWSIVLTSLFTFLITSIFLFAWCRNRHRFNARRRPSATANFEPLSVVYTNAPPAFEEEDEIAYIARTGNVATSSAACSRPSRAIRFQK